VTNDTTHLTAHGPADASQRDTELALAKNILQIEADAVSALIDRIDESFLGAVDLVSVCQGRVISTGMGKSGIIARKFAATLSSTGTAAYFVHPAEALHGDLGAIQTTDIVVSVSQSGETPELVRLLEMTRRLGVKTIALTGTPSSTLATNGDIVLDCGVQTEACPLNLAPSASTTAALALGDALALVLAYRNGFKATDFAHLHPGGILGKRLLRVDRLMHTGADVPTVTSTALFPEVIKTISAAGFGMTCVQDTDDLLLGIVTDGDIRRCLATTVTFENKTARDVMTQRPHYVKPDTLAVDALNLMEKNRITSLAVTDDDGKLYGILHLHDLWRTELF
jgi:arabinose-5-phosphate isomerase